MAKTAGRPQKPHSERARNAGFSAYPREIAAIERAARVGRFKTGFDFIRRLIITNGHPATEGKITEPRMKSQSRL